MSPDESGQGGFASWNKLNIDPLRRGDLVVFGRHGEGRTHVESPEGPLGEDLHGRIPGRKPRRLAKLRGAEKAAVAIETNAGDCSQAPRIRHVVLIVPASLGDKLGADEIGDRHRHPLIVSRP